MANPVPAVAGLVWGANQRPDGDGDTKFTVQESYEDTSMVGYVSQALGLAELIYFMGALSMAKISPDSILLSQWAQAITPEDADHGLDRLRDLMLAGQIVMTGPMHPEIVARIQALP